MDADVIVVGAGLAGLVVGYELAAADRSVIMLDSEPLESIGGQAYWALGGLFMVNSSEQRRLRIHDSEELALADWLGSAAFDRGEDYWPRRWAEAYVNFAAGEQRSWLHGLGVRWFPLVQWAERGGYATPGHGNSVPRFHITWAPGPGYWRPSRAASCTLGEYVFDAGIRSPRWRWTIPAYASPARFWSPQICLAAYRLRAPLPGSSAIQPRP